MSQPDQGSAPSAEITVLWAPAEVTRHTGGQDSCQGVVAAGVGHGVRPTDRKLKIQEQYVTGSLRKDSQCATTAAISVEKGTTLRKRALVWGGNHSPRNN